jgi:glucose-6-phosphate 1-epimerase
LEHASTDQHGATQVRLGLRQYAECAHALFAPAFTARLDFSFGQKLRIDLKVSNCSSIDMPLSWALHSYHTVQDLDQLRIIGLKNNHYLDNTRHLERYKQTSEALRVQGELDRAYLSVGATQAILGAPDIRISGVNAPTAIVWNPGAAIAASLPDLGAGTHLQFICLERGAAFDDTPTLAPHSTLLASVVIEPGNSAD